MEEHECAHCESQKTLLWMIEFDSIVSMGFNLVERARIEADGNQHDYYDYLDVVDMLVAECTDTTAD